MLTWLPGVRAAKLFFAMKCLPSVLQCGSEKPGKIGVWRAGLQRDCYWRFATFCRDRTADAGTLTTAVAENAEAARRLANVAADGGRSNADLNHESTKHGI